MSKDYIDECKSITLTNTYEEYRERFLVWKKMANHYMESNVFDEAAACCEILNSMWKLYLKRTFQKGVRLTSKDWHNVRVAFELDAEKTLKEF